MTGTYSCYLCDYAHYLVCCSKFSQRPMLLNTNIVQYTTSSVVGSTDAMWELLTEAAGLHPVEGNADGSYMTMKSVDGALIGLVLVGAGFGAAVDSQLFQKAIAAEPKGTLWGYLLGGTCWFTIPFVLASTFGLAAAATEHLPSFPVSVLGKRLLFGEDLG